MASQPTAQSDLDVVEINSFVLGYHQYMDRWKPVVGEMLLLQREPNNPKDKCAVSVMKGGDVVGHVPYNLAPVMSSFLQRGSNKGTVEVTGAKVNRGGGYGLEVPCKYKLYGPKRYTDRASTVFASLRDRGQL